MLLRNTDSAPGSLDPDLIQRCLRIQTATWSDALDSLGCDGVMQGLTVRSGNGRVAGGAVPVKQEGASLDTYAMERFDVGGIIQAPPAGSIPVIAMNGEP